MKFEEFLISLGDDARDELAAAWRRCVALLNTATGAHRQFAINLEAESRLPVDAWNAVSQVILLKKDEMSELQTLFTVAFRSYILKGPATSLPVNIPLGRALTRDIFLGRMKEQFVFSSDDEQEQFLNDLLDPAATVDSIRDLILDKELGSYLMWATFDLGPDLEPSGRDPFHSIHGGAATVAARLGLSPTYKGQDLLLLVYELPMALPAQYPTIADAYADDAWPYYFRPSLTSDRWGSTMPWEEKLTPCPEVVHEIVRGNQLRDKIRVVLG